MSSDPLDALLLALQASPENTVLRAHLVRELLKSRRWALAEQTARPLAQDAQLQPLAWLAQARLLVSQNQLESARELYRQAIARDRLLVDEVLEAELEPDQPLRIPIDGPEDAGTPIPAETRTLSFADIGGMESLKEQLRLTILYPMQRPELYQAYGKKVGGGILLYGPPGCGKTHLARATAGEMGASFFIVSLQDVLSKWMGETEKAISGIFEVARSKSPAVIFIDEVDALGSKRSDIQSASVRWTVSQFLVEMDGIAANNEKLLVLGATNAPWSVDSALRRPGRFDRVLFVPPPDPVARQEILQIHSRGRKLAPNIDWRDLARRTEHFSGADLMNLVERATERALSDALKSGDLRDVTGQDFLAALKVCRASTMEWLRRSRNYCNFANQDGLYDDLASYLDKVKIR